MNFPYLALLAAGLYAGSTFAGSGEELAVKGNCMTCHAVNQKSLGPSFLEVAAKYRNDKAAQATLERKVRNGGAGVWGKMPMPSTAKSISDDEVRSIVQWVLSLR